MGLPGAVAPLVLAAPPPPAATAFNVLAMFWFWLLPGEGTEGAGAFGGMGDEAGAGLAAG